MKIVVDADACPVKEIIVREAKERSIEVIMFIDTSHELDDGYSKVVTVGKGADAADLALVNAMSAGDIVVTQDYGVAAMALSKRGRVLNQDGMEYTNGNIERLLFQRYVAKKVRSGGGRTQNPKKRTKEDNIRFEESLKRILDEGR